MWTHSSGRGWLLMSAGDVSSKYASTGGVYGKAFNGQVMCIRAPCEFPLANATLRFLRRQDGYYSQVYRTTTDSTGAYQLRLAPGEYQVTSSTSVFWIGNVTVGYGWTHRNFRIT